MAVGFRAAGELRAERGRAVLAWLALDDVAVLGRCERQRGRSRRRPDVGVRIEVAERRGEAPQALQGVGAGAAPHLISALTSFSVRRATAMRHG